MRRNISKVVLNDKASYFVNKDMLNKKFAAGLRAGGFTSWASPDGDDGKWLAGNLGDLYLHETVISHVRRLLDTKFMRKALNEKPWEFKARMLKVEKYMNYTMGRNGPGQALSELGNTLHERCGALIERKGERLPK